MSLYSWIKLLEKSPNKFHSELQKLLKYDPNEAKFIINMNTSEVPLYGNALHALAYITGNLINTNSNTNSNKEFYGKNTMLDQNTSICIFNLMIKCGANINHKDYYGNTVLDIIKKSLTKRENNKKFIKILNNSSISESIN